MRGRAGPPRGLLAPAGQSRPCSGPEGRGCVCVCARACLVLALRPVCVCVCAHSALSDSATCVCMCICVCERAHTLYCPTLCDPMNCSPPGSSGHWISQARILEWAVISFFRGSIPPWGGICGPLHLLHWWSGQVHSEPTPLAGSL